MRLTTRWIWIANSIKDNNFEYLNVSKPNVCKLNWVVEETNRKLEINFRYFICEIPTPAYFKILSVTRNYLNNIRPNLKLWENSISSNTISKKMPDIY